MLHVKIPSRILPALLGGVALAPASFAGQVTYSDSVPLATTNWTNSVDLTRFDPQLGILQSVVVSLEAHNEGSAAFENLDPVPAAISMTFSTRIEVRRPDDSVILFAEPTVNTMDNAAAFDGVIDMAGTSGRTYGNLSQTVMESHSSPRPMSDLALFTGPAGNPGLITLPVRAQGQSFGSGSGNLVLAFSSQASAVVTVTYLFGADCNMNGVPDDIDISGGTSLDCDQNGVPDECQPDCDKDGVPDVCEPDCNGDGTPNDCESDCDDDGTPDGCEPDCDGDGTPDDCDESPCPDCKELNRRNPGSLLLYPFFDNRGANITLVTVTNVDCTEASGTIDVEFVYIGRYGPDNVDLPCLETNRTRRLTPCDTLTVWTRFDNPNHERGYLYVFAKSPVTGQAVVFNQLIGQAIYFSPDQTLQDALNAVSFRGVGEQGDPTDADGDGVRDLDGLEYEEAPDQILIPRFLGQSDAGVPGLGYGGFHSQLVLVALSGGTAFTTTLDFLVYNDNEEVFSAQYTFDCWDIPYLTEINDVFENDFLKYSTVHDPNEILGEPSRESGWMRIDGNVAQSSQAEIPDPAFYAVLIERAGAYAVADLPWELCSQANGDLLPHGLFGDM